MSGILRIFCVVAVLTPGINVLAHAKTVTLNNPVVVEEITSLVNGLEAAYAYQRFQHVDELVTWQNFEPGTPVESLNLEAAREPVLTSSSLETVGARLNGLIHLATPGTYEFRATSDDGVRLSIGNFIIFDDPLRHEARKTPIATVRVLQPGWFRIRCLYFQVDQDWQLKIEWKQPGQTNFTPLPAPVLAHKSTPDTAFATARKEADEIVAAARREALRILTEARKEATEIRRGNGETNAATAETTAETSAETTVPPTTAATQSPEAQSEAAAAKIEAATPVPAKNGKPTRKN